MIRDMNNKILVKNTLSSDSFLRVNRNIMADLGDATATLVLSLIIDKHTYFEKRGELDGDSFFITKEVLMNDLGLSEKVILNAEKRLEKRGYVVYQLRGLPRKKYYTIQWERISHTLQNVGTQPTEGMSRIIQNDMGKETKNNNTKVNEMRGKEMRDETLEMSSTITPITQSQWEQNKIEELEAMKLELGW